MKEDSINDLMELSMGLSMATVFARAMGNMMEHSMAQVERANAPLGDPSFATGQISTQAYIHAIMDGRQQGPFTLSQILSFIREGRITAETYMWKPGMTAWMHAVDIEDIAPDLQCVPPPIPEK